jgi:RNA polymerase sigma factor (sigma-70 family)
VKVKGTAEGSQKTARARTLDPGGLEPMLDDRLSTWPSLRAIRGLFVPVRRWSSGDVALSPAERYRRETDLEGAIRILPVELRTVFELAYWHDLKHVEIAEALGVPLDTVAARFSRAKERLQHLLIVEDPV